MIYSSVNFGPIEMGQVTFFLSPARSFQNGLKVMKKHIHILKFYDRCLTIFEGQVLDRD
jgi:hypothetical protein